MGKHRLTPEQATAEKTVADMDALFKARGITKQIRDRMTPAGRDAVDRTLSDHQRRR